MEKNQKLFSYESKFLKFISIQPLDLISVHPRLRLAINVLYQLFWHFVVSHLAILQTVTIVLNFEKTLDDIIDYAMIGSIYSYGYFCILCYWQFYWGELSRLMDFVRQNFRTRSAKGREQIKSSSELLNPSIVSGLTFVSCEESVERSSKYCVVWIAACLAGNSRCTGS